MYEKQFGLKTPPFSSLPDPEFLVSLPQYVNASKRLEYSIRTSEGFTLLSGEIGCGKTTLLRHVQKKLGGSFVSGFIADTVRLENNVLERVLLSLGQELPQKDWSTKFKQLTDYLLEHYSNGKRVVVIFDEAQNLSQSCLEEIRVLSNINSGNARLIEFVLSGSPELRQNLARAENSKVTQRIDHAYHLLPLTEKETIHYIYKRLTMAGAKKASIFTKEACDLIYRASGGIPRIINQLCHTSLIYAYGMDVKRVTQAVVKVVLNDRAHSWAASPLDQQDDSQNDGDSTDKNIVRTEIDGWHFHNISPGFEHLFPQTQHASLQKSSWLTVIPQSERDRISKIFKHYLEIGNHHFQISSKIQGNEDCGQNSEIPAKLVFEREDGMPHRRYQLSVRIFDHNAPSI